MSVKRYPSLWDNGRNNNDYPRKNNGASWSPRPTNAMIPNIMQVLKKLIQNVISGQARDDVL
jgi:hypothetical protein